MKNILLAIALVSLVGCAANPPKSSVVVTNSSEITLSDKSSQALLDIQAANIQGVRDLTIKEFNQNKKDIERFEAMTGSRDGFNRLAYETGGVGLGLAAGLSMGTVLGYGAITSLVADDRPDNYKFAWDFDGRVLVISKKNKVDVAKLHSSILSVMERLPNIYPDMFLEQTELSVTQDGDGLAEQYKREEYNNKRKIKFTQEPMAYQRIGKSSMLDGKVVTPYSASTQSFCSDKQTGACEIVVNVYNFSKGRSGMHMIQSNLLLRLIASELDSDHFLYLPPNKALYRLPMIVRGGTGEIEYLVEKE